MSNDMNAMMDFDDGFDYEDLEAGQDPTGSTDDDTSDDDTSTDDDDNEDVKDDDTSDDNTSDDDSSDDDEESNEPVDSDAIVKYYEFLNESGLLKTDEDFKFDNSSESLKQAFEQTKKNTQKEAADTLWEIIPDDYKPILKYAFLNGGNPKEFLQTYLNDGEVNVEDLDLEDTDNQKYVMYQYYKSTTNHSDDKIDRLINLLDTQGSLKEEAEDSILELKNIQESNREAMLEQAELQKQQDELDEQSTKEVLFEIVDDLETSSERKSKIKSFMYSTSNGVNKFINTLASITNTPEHFVQLVDLLLDYDPKKGLDISDRFTKQGKSKAIDEFESKLKDKFSDSKVKTKGGRTTTAPDKMNWNLIFGSDD